MTYNGNSLLLPLQPVDGEQDKFSSRQGHIENFVLHTSVVEAGAPLHVLFSDVPDTSVIEVKLTPSGPLADGSKGRILLFRQAGRAAVGQQREFGGIPIGRYILTAKAYDGKDALPLRVRQTFRVDGVEQPLAASLTVDFEGDLQQQTLPGQTNLRRFQVTIQGSDK